MIRVECRVVKIEKPQPKPKEKLDFSSRVFSPCHMHYVEQYNTSIDYFVRSSVRRRFGHVLVVCYCGLLPPGDGCVTTDSIILVA